MSIKKTLSILLLAVLIANFATVKPAVASGEVLFECENLKAALEDILDKDGITTDDMYEIKGKLDLSYKNIKSLAGLEYAVNVSDLVLSFNNITDISPLTALSNLKSLYLDYNWLKTLPDWDMGFSSLEHLDISNNDISKIPSAFLDLPTLRRFYMGDLVLSAPLDLSYVKDTLNRLDISSAIFEDYAFVEGLAGLELLIMNGCELDSLPDLSQMKSLSYLYFSDNNISSLPEYLGSLPLLRLDFSGNLISFMPQSFSSLKQLKQLVFTDNYFLQLPQVVTSMTSLEVLMCGQNIIEDVPSNLFELKDIKRASFASNNLKSLEKFREFNIPYSYQISFDYNYLNLSDETNISVLEDYHNDGGIQKQAVLSAEVVSADTNSLVVKCEIDVQELDRIGENAKHYSLMLFADKGDGLELLGETDLSDESSELLVTYQNPPPGAADYIVCLVIIDESWPSKYIKYSSALTGVQIVNAQTPEPTQTPPEEMVSPTDTPDKAPPQENGTSSKFLLYILLLGVIIIISAIIIHLVFYRRK